MKRIIFAVTLCLALTFLWGCISFKKNPLFPAENTVESIQLCQGIDDSKDLSKPLNIKSEFTLEDEQVICFVQLKEVTSKIYLRWKWYSPDRKLIRDTGEVLVNQDGRYLEAVTAYDRLKLGSEGDIAGQWTVVFFLNSNFCYKKHFQMILKLSAASISLRSKART